MIIEKQYINKQAHNSVLVQLKKAQARNPLQTSVEKDSATNNHSYRKND